jgi:hypothetical protein
MECLWICGRVLRTCHRPSGRVDKPWITKRRYPPLDHTRWLRAHIPTGSITGVSLTAIVVDSCATHPRQQEKVGLKLYLKLDGSLS